MATKKTVSKKPRSTKPLPYALTEKAAKPAQAAIVPGSPEDIDAWAARQSAAHDVLANDFREIREQLDALDEAIISALADVASHDELNNTRQELARIAQASFCVRSVLPGAKWKVQP